MLVYHYTRTKLGALQKEMKHLSGALNKMKVDSNLEKECHKVAMAAKNEEYQSLKSDFEGQMTTIKGTEEEL